MSNQYSSYLRVTPPVLRLGGVKKVTIHARQKHVLKQLDSVARILVYPVGSTVPTAGNLLSVTEVTPFERLDNGDIVFPVETTIEGAYTVHLSAQKEDGSFSEIMVIELYALADDLFDLRIIEPRVKHIVIVITVAAVCQNRSGITENLIAVLFNSPRITQRRAAVVFRSRHL